MWYALNDRLLTIINHWEYSNHGWTVCGNPYNKMKVWYVRWGRWRKAGGMCIDDDGRFADEVVAQCVCL